MKDPLDQRNDPYQRFNDEAESQGKPPQVVHNSKPMDVRRVFGPLRARSRQPAGLQEAYDKLTTVASRLEEDILFYWIEEETRGVGESLPEPDWKWDSPIAVPELPIAASLLQIVTGSENEFLDPVRFRTITLSDLTRYEETQLPPLEIVFEK